MEEREIPVKNINLGQRYIFERAIPSKQDPLLIMGKKKRDQFLLDKYGGTMPLSWIFEQSRRLEKKAMEPMIETEKIMKVFWEKDGNTIKAGIKDLEGDNDITIECEFNVLEMIPDKDRIRHTFDKLFSRVNP